MTITEEQRAAVRRWIEAGAGLADVQRRLKEEHGLSMTYLDVRFLVDDLDLSLKEPPRAEDTTERLEAARQASPDSPETPDAPMPPEGPARVRVTLDTVTRPHALISGRVTFSDGQGGEWHLDEMGRLAVNPSTPGYRPSQTDIMAFQIELQRMARSQGL